MRGRGPHGRVRAARGNEDFGAAAAGLAAAAILGAALAACAAQSPQFALTRETTAELLARCAGCPSPRELARAVQTPAQLEFVQRVNALEARMTGLPLAGGNKVELLLDGPDTHAAQLRAIRGARHHVHLITYILTDDRLAHQYLEALADRTRRGVRARLMFDAVGGRTVAPGFREALRAAGVEVREFGPMNPLADGAWSTTRRHHRKILVVDGRIGFTGGINISDEYRSSSAGSGSRDQGWRDTSIVVQGPGVAQFQEVFFDSWQSGYESIEEDPRYWPELEERGDTFVRMVAQAGTDLPGIIAAPVDKALKEPDPQDRSIYGSYLAAISAAQQRVWITQAYFIPNDEFLGVLQRAARRQVDVRVLVPSQSDIALMVHASRFHYAPLLEAGARIYEYAGPMLHAKTAVVDGVWATVGSSNIDFRSFIHNDEANATVIGADFGARMERMYLDDLARAREITREEWARRSWAERVRQRLAVMLKYWI
jgi:cardiolipin synthase A/B